MGKEKKSNRSVLTPDDLSIWNKVASTATPMDKAMKNLTTAEIFDNAEPKSTHPFNKTAAIKNPDNSFVSQPSYQAPKHSDAKPALHLDKKTVRKIAKGKISIQGQIDLHGMTSSLAHRQLFNYVEYAYYSDKRTILVITGKGIGGMGVLRNNVPRWLREVEFRAYVSSVTPSQPNHGGEGALYVRIKRRQA